MTGRVCVVGSFAVGLSLRVAHLPAPGETVAGGGFAQGPGGKGSNQAVQLARLGVRTELVAMLGEDEFAAIARELYVREGVGTVGLMSTPDAPTGVGFIVVDARGENTIALDPGANALLTAERVQASAELITACDVVVCQLEIPVEAVGAALRVAREAGAITVLNPAPAPAEPLPAALLADVDVLTPNQTEARILLGLDAGDRGSDEDLCERLLSLGVGAVVLTRGASGALVVDAGGSDEIPAWPVEAVDTTGAGDAFTATLAAGLSDRLPLRDAAGRAAAAGALTCGRPEVVPALPTRGELEEVVALMSIEGKPT